MVKKSRVRIIAQSCISTKCMKRSKRENQGLKCETVTTPHIVDSDDNSVTCTVCGKRNLINK